MQRWLVGFLGLLLLVAIFVAGWLVLGGREDGDVVVAPAREPTTAGTSDSVATPIPSSSSVVTSTISATSTSVPSRLEIAETVGDSPTTVALPPAENLELTSAFLAGDGFPLVVFVAETSDFYLLDTGDVGSCTVLANDLDGVIAAPVELSSLATRVPDPVTSELFVSDIALKSRLLGTCGTDATGNTAAEVAWQSELLERRLSELGVEW